MRFMMVVGRMGSMYNIADRDWRKLMFSALKEQPADKILALMQMFKDDPRTKKIDLGVGVYKNAKATLL